MGHEEGRGLSFETYYYLEVEPKTRDQQRMLKEAASEGGQPKGPAVKIE